MNQTRTQHAEVTQAAAQGELGATEEQLRYAAALDVGMKIGLGILVVTFTIYLLGIVPPHIPHEELPRYWSLPVADYLQQAAIEPGWSWLGMLGKGDFLNFLGIAFLAGLTIVCYLLIIPILKRKKDNVYLAIAVLEVLVLVLAASGLLTVGAH